MAEKTRWSEGWKIHESRPMQDANIDADPPLSLRRIVRECYQAEKAASVKFEVLHVPDAAQKAAIVLASLEEIARKQKIPIENLLEHGFDMAALRNDQLRFTPPASNSSSQNQ